MNWISEVVRPKIKTLFKRESPDNLWIKCPDTGQMVLMGTIAAFVAVAGEFVGVATSGRPRSTETCESRS